MTPGPQLVTRSCRIAAGLLVALAAASLANIGLSWATGAAASAAYYAYCPGSAPPVYSGYCPSPPTPTTVTLAPAADANPVSTPHTVTATVRDQSTAPMAGVVVRFSVGGSVSASGFCTTNAAGQCSFTYTGPIFPGADVITAFADTDNDLGRDPSEPSGTAAKTWVLPASTCGQVDGKGSLSTNLHARFFLDARFETGSPTGKVVYADELARVGFTSSHIDALVIVGNQATIYGRGVSNGTAVLFRVTVTDGPDTFTITLSNGYTATGAVTSGSIRIGPCHGPPPGH